MWQICWFWHDVLWYYRLYDDDTGDKENYDDEDDKDCGAFSPEKCSVIFHVCVKLQEISYEILSTQLQISFLICEN